MKKQIILFGILVLLIVAIVSACKKDPDPNNNEPSSDKIHFGDTTGMMVTPRNAIMEFDENNKPLMIDLDGNGTHDIKIETCYDGPLAIGEFQTLTLYCLNSHVELLADSVVKESYSHRETTYDTIDDFVVITHAFIFSTCDKIDENDPVNTSKVFEAFTNNEEDSFGVDDHFLSGDVILFRENIKYELADPGDEVVNVDLRNYIYDCWNFPTDEEKYIGFKLTSNGNSRLGWLKIKLRPTWGNSVVDTELIETAIQK